MVGEPFLFYYISYYPGSWIAMDVTCIWSCVLVYYIHTNTKTCLHSLYITFHYVQIVYIDICILSTMVQKSFMVSFYLAEQRQYLRLCKENGSWRNGILFSFAGGQSGSHFPCLFYGYRWFRALLYVHVCTNSFKCFCDSASYSFFFCLSSKIFFFFLRESLARAAPCLACCNHWLKC